MEDCLYLVLVLIWYKLIGHALWQLPVSTHISTGCYGGCHGSPWGGSCSIWLHRGVSITRSDPCAAALWGFLCTDFYRDPLDHRFFLYVVAYDSISISFTCCSFLQCLIVSVRMVSVFTGLLMKATVHLAKSTGRQWCVCWLNFPGGRYLISCYGRDEGVSFYRKETFLASG